MNDQRSPLHDPHAPAQPAAALPDRTIDRDYCLAVEAERDFLRERNKKLEARHKEDVRLLDRLSEAEGRYLKAEAQLEQYQKAEQVPVLVSKDPESIELGEIENFELVFSVQIDDGRVLELLVDEIFSGDCVWQVTNASGQVLERSDVYQEQAHCLRDGLNKTLN